MHIQLVCNPHVINGNIRRDYRTYVFDILLRGQRETESFGARVQLKCTEPGEPNHVVCYNNLFLQLAKNILIVKDH